MEGESPAAGTLSSEQSSLQRDDSTGSSTSGCTSNASSVRHLGNAVHISSALGSCGGLIGPWALPSVQDDHRATVQQTLQNVCLQHTPILEDMGTSLDKNAVKQSERVSRALPGA